MTSFFTCHEEFAREVQLLLLGFGINAKVKREDKQTETEKNLPVELAKMHCEASNRFPPRIGFIGNRKKTSGCRRYCRTTFGFKNEMTDGILGGPSRKADGLRSHNQRDASLWSQWGPGTQLHDGK